MGPSSKLATFSLSDANHDVRSNRRIDNNNNRNCDAKLRMPKRIKLVGCTLQSPSDIGTLLGGAIYRLNKVIDGSMSRGSNHSS